MLAAPVDFDQLTGVWQIGLVHSQVGFTVRHLMIRMRGGFTRFSGTITVGNEPARSSVRAKIDCTLVDTRNAERDKHIRAADCPRQRHPPPCIVPVLANPHEGRSAHHRGAPDPPGPDVLGRLRLVPPRCGYGRNRPDSGGISGLLLHQPLPAQSDRRCASDRRTCADRRHRHGRSGDRGGPGPLAPTGDCQSSGP